MINDALLVLGGLTVAGGVALVHLPAGIMLLGAVVVAVAILREFGEARKGE